MNDTAKEREHVVIEKTEAQRGEAVGLNPHDSSGQSPHWSPRPLTRGPGLSPAPPRPIQLFLCSWSSSRAFSSQGSSHFPQPSCVFHDFLVFSQTVFFYLAELSLFPVGPAQQQYLLSHLHRVKETFTGHQDVQPSFSTGAVCTVRGTERAPWLGHEKGVWPGS